MKHQPVPDTHLKANAPLWKKLLSLSMPEWTPIKIAVAALLTVFIVLLGMEIAPEQSTSDFKAATVNTPALEFSDTKLAAYDGVQMFIRRSGQGGFSGSSNSSKTGGILIQGKIKNTTDEVLFLTVGYPIGSIRTGDVSGVTLNVNGKLQGNRGHLKVSGAAYLRGGSEDRFAGYYIAPSEKLGFEIFSDDIDIDSPDPFEIELQWVVLDAVTSAPRIANPVFDFQPNGSSLIWGEGVINWYYPFPPYR